MVEGTHLLKKSSRSVALGIDRTNPQAPCLFCHDKNATPSVVNRDRMKGVWDHFDATSTSKHRADLRSGFGDQASLFDCRDCHTGIDVGVVSDGGGNARVHGIDASGGTRLNVQATLVGWQSSGYSLSAHTCSNAACHGGTAPVSYGTFAARPAHGMSKTTLAGGAVPTACTQCHGTHNSYQNTSLITLRTDGTTSNNPVAPLATRVTPEKCGVCHVQDDAGTYAARGHGQSGISGGSIGCTACHTGSVAHRFSKDAPGHNPLRFAFAENTSVQSVIRRQPPYNQVYSICLTCHGQYSKSHGKTEFAGCNDCHEPHGAGVAGNIAMVRSQIPKVNASGNPIYGANATSGAWETIIYTSPLDAFRTDGRGLCDNAECHQGRQSARGTPLYPLAAFFSGDGHSEGVQPPASNCKDCHKHQDSSGSWGARDSCTSCHGQPPPPAVAGYTRFSEAATGHRKHAGDGTGQYAYDCSRCHGGYPGSHLNGGFQDVVFDALNPGGSYIAGSATCTSLYCHSDGQSAASVAASPAWDAGPLTCRACHGGVEGPTRIATVSHSQHLGSGSTCAHCHGDTVTSVGTDTTTQISGLTAHVNGVKNLKASGTFAGQPVTFATGGAATCSAISCHNGGSANWGAALACSDCHFRTTAQGGDRDNFVYGDGVLSAVSSDEWANTGHGRPASGPAPSGNYPSGNPAANFSGPAADPRGCAYCHNPAVGHGVGTNPFRLANQGVRSGTGNEHGGWNDACLVCHGTGSTGYDPDGVGGVYTVRNGTRNVGENHYGNKHGAGRNGGAFCWDCHDPHGDDQHYMVQGGAGVTSQSDGLYGIPVTRRPVTGFDVVSGGYTSSDLVNAANTGLCQTCHTVAGYYNQSTNTPLTDHNSAHTTHCTACHTHDNDFGAGCTSCHGYPPPDSPFTGTGVAWTSDKAAAPATLGLHATHAAGANPYVTGSCFLTCHTGDTHLTNKLTADMGVKAATAGASTGIYQYATLDNFDVWTGGALPGNQSVVDDTCANVSCHASTYGSPANRYRSAANPGYTRYWNQNLNCYACHAYDGVAAAAPRPTADVIATGSHGAHVGTYALSCTNCHPSSGYTNAHKNGFVTFATNFGATRVPSATGGFYDLDGVAPFSTVANLVPRENGGTGYFCASVYCHSSGEPRGPETIAYRNDTRWTQAATGSCGTCHAVDGVAGSGSLATNVHEKHVGSAAGQYGYACTACHATVVGGVKPAYTIASTALHVNGINNVAFGANEGTYSLNSGGTVAPAGGTCSATYCHSQGLDRSAPYTQTNNAPRVEADWDHASGVLGCNGCHGSASAAYPGYPNNTSVKPGSLPADPTHVKKNSHAAHGSYECRSCHAATAGAGNVIATAANHGNKVWDLLAGAGATFTVQAGTGTISDAAYVPTTCNTISCHGGANAQWGATLTCTDCHFRTAAQGGDRDNFVHGDGIAALVSSTEWASTGHGRTTAYPSGNPAANQANRFSSCTTYCHTTTVPHGVATNPFRLRTSGGQVNFSDTGYPQNDNTVCLDCHSATGALSNQATTYVNQSHYGGSHTTGRNGGAFCWDCHDPHGDDQHFMIQGGAGVTAQSDGVYGIPLTRRPVTGLDVGSGGYTSADLVNTNNTGLCQTCHASNGGALYYNRSTFTALNLHNGADTTHCTACHTHDTGFAPSGCDSCHGDGNGKNWPANAVGSYPNRAGAHNAHVAALGTGNASCVACHPGNPPLGHPGDDASGVNRAEVSRMDTTGNGVPNFWTTSYFKTLQGANDTDAVYSAVNQTCLNINCHNNEPTPPWYGGGGAPDTAPPAWSGGVSGVAATNLATGGAVRVTWNTATDAVSPPVRYDLYWATSAANVFTNPLGTMVNLATTQADVAGLANGTAHYFGVRAKDARGNTTTNTDTATATPTAAPGGATTDYFLRKDNGTALWGAVSTNGNACGQLWSVALVNGFPPNARGLLSATKACANNTNNYVTPASGQANALRTLAGFYLPTPYAVDTLVSGNALGNSFGFQANATNKTVAIYLASVNASGAHTLSEGSYSQTTIPNGMTHYQPNLSGLTIPVQAGSRLAVIVQFDTRNAISGNDRVALDAYNTTILNRIRLTETPVDTTPPAFAGGVSGIAVSNPATGGELSVSWNTATDATGPVTYRVFRSTAPQTNPFTNPDAGWPKAVGATSLVDTGLINGTTYYYGVRAQDNASPPNVTTNSDTASGVPTDGTGGSSCTLCHGAPPATGAHLAHAGLGNMEDCNACHGDATRTVSGSYANFGPVGLHNNGLVDLYFRYDGDPVTASWNGTSCTNIDCHYNNPTPSWTGGTTTCSSCHALPPTGAAARAHPAHYMGKGWAMGNTANCTACHPDNTTRHSNVADRSVIVNSALGPAGAAPAVTCGTAPGLGCHNEHATPAWNTTAISCTACHTPGGSAPADPVTGLHRITAAGPRAHDHTLPGGGCTACHNAAKPATHADGTFVADSTANTDRFLARSGMTYSDGAANAATCAGGGLVGCHTDGGAWARLWSTEADSAATAPRSARCNVCHGQWASISGSAGWREGTTHYKAGGANSSDNDRGTAHEPSAGATCDGCHVYGAAGNSRHNVPTGSPAQHRVTANTNATTYARSGANAGCTACHGGASDAAYNFPVSVFANQLVSGAPVPAPGCADCHAGNNDNAPQTVWPNGNASGRTTAYGSHLKALKTETLGGGTDWNAQCKKCHPGHSGGSVTIPLPPTSWNNGNGDTNLNMQEQLKIDYTQFGGIHLGGTATSGTTEAQICWNCHDLTANSVSEWGTNTHAVTGSSPYDYGYLYTALETGTTRTSNWVTGFWRSGRGKTSSEPFWMKRGATRSIHSTNFSTGTSTLTGSAYAYTAEAKESVADIRCSHCHAVHDHVRPASKGGGVVGPIGKPHLRGTYRSNPYPEDGPPYNKAYASRNKYGAVPRGGPQYNEEGGFFIDQNSGFPTNDPNWNTVEKTAGLCLLCHGTNIDTMDWRTGENLWVGSNGHSASALGGTGIYKANIFDYTHGRPAPVVWGSRASGTMTTQVPNMAYVMQAKSTEVPNASGPGEGYGYRGWESGTYTGQYNPPTNPASRGYGFRDYMTAGLGWGAAWNSLTGVTVDAATIDYPYHKFTCSKCHNPHASRLPKLMITNCLDIRHNTWDDARSTLQTKYTAAALTDRNKYAAYYDSAQNCHRRDDGQNAKNPGWNKVTPW
jgi:predicted CxxxxCH...CXXCH cytochrome family protein